MLHRLPKSRKILFVYTDLLRKEIYSKSVQNLILCLGEVHEYFLRFSLRFSQISCS